MMWEDSDKYRINDPVWGHKLSETHKWWKVFKQIISRKRKLLDNYDDGNITVLENREA